ncbi:MFS transporter [Parabacteroides chinchillae]|uniref:MFS transporter, DHA2 family, multidrug resistance protein n=1 Tax=Parabacteroides chinchillae TaxID=871327 RepID=A0A8G2BXD2_9BACT|nr:MFS transporter [Parabacteroides chinchillae]SEG02611.1 MFS transporter, DHA2 family, multidrug resistance protein [Parabacteroides chinchillae]
MSDNTNLQVPDGVPVPRRYWAILAIGFGITVSVLDGVIANVALPAIAKDLHTNPSLSIWVVNAYQLAITISLLSLSSIGEIWGYRKVYTYGLLLFSCTSLACALSDSLSTLIIARTLQGFGAAAITSVNTALIRIIYPKRFLARGMGLNALVISVSAAAGPTIAAGILSVANWPWLFAINIPIGVTALLISYRFLPPNPIKIKGRRFDIEGGLLNAVTFALLIAIIEGFTHDINIYIILIIVTIAILTGYVYIKRETKQDYPLFPVDLLKIPIFSLSILASVFSFMSQMLAMVSLPFFLQRVLGKDEVATGLLLTPWPLATMIFAPLAGFLSDKIKAGMLGCIGMLIFATGLFLLATMPSNPSNIEIIWRMAICGCGFGLFQTPNNSTIIGSAPSSRSGGASGMLGTARLMGQTMGASLVALMFKLFPGHSMHVSLLLGCIISVVAAFISVLRVGNKI